MYGCRIIKLPRIETHGHLTVVEAEKQIPFKVERRDPLDSRENVANLPYFALVFPEAIHGWAKGGLGSIPKMLPVGLSE